MFLGESKLANLYIYIYIYINEVANTIEIHTHTCEAFFFNDKYIIIKKQVHAQDEQRPLKQL
jgi:hypothetical protein